MHIISSTPIPAGTEVFDAEGQVIGRIDPSGDGVTAYGTIWISQLRPISPGTTCRISGTQFTIWRWKNEPVHWLPSEPAWPGFHKYHSQACLYLQEIGDLPIDHASICDDGCGQRIDAAYSSAYSFCRAVAALTGLPVRNP